MSDMNFVLVDIVKYETYGYYRTEQGAKIGKTRKHKHNANIKVMSRADAAAFLRTVPKKKVRNLMTGELVEIDINTPLSCDPSSETYWSM